VEQAQQSNRRIYCIITLYVFLVMPSCETCKTFSGYVALYVPYRELQESVKARRCSSCSDLNGIVEQISKNLQNLKVIEAILINLPDPGNDCHGDDYERSVATIKVLYYRRNSDSREVGEYAVYRPVGKFFLRNIRVVH
jgi:hypothetical protein